MAITDQDRARIGQLALDAIDDIIRDYGEDAVLEDAVLIYEVSYPDPVESDLRAGEFGGKTTTHRATVAGGLAYAYAMTQLSTWASSDEAEDG